MTSDRTVPLRADTAGIAAAAWGGAGQNGWNLRRLTTLPTAEIRKQWQHAIANGVPIERWGDGPGLRGSVCSFSDATRRPTIVASFPRSGTHFLMNTLAENFGYIADPWLALENTPINFFHGPSVRRLLRLIERRRYRNIGKTHRSSEFFRDAICASGAQVQVFYVYRHPAHCLNSYRKYLATWRGDFPCDAARDIIDFMEWQPQGIVAVDAWNDPPTMLDFWADHVRGWLDLAQETGAVHLVRYEDLVHDFGRQVAGIAACLGVSATPAKRPDPSAFLSQGPIPRQLKDARGWLELADRHVRWKHPGLLERLGYDREGSACAPRSCLRDGGMHGG